MPQNTSADVAGAASHRLIAALQNPAPNAPFSENYKSTAAALDRLANIFLLKVNPQVQQPPPRVTQHPPRPKFPRVVEEDTPASTVFESAWRKRIRLRNESRAVHTKNTAPQLYNHEVERLRPQKRVYQTPTMATTLPTPNRNNNLQPALIEPDDDDPANNTQQMNHMVAQGVANRLHREFVASPVSSKTLPHKANSVIYPITGAVYDYRHLQQVPDAYIWKQGLANDLGKLAQGVGRCTPKGMNTIFYIHPSKIPKHKKVSYCRLVAVLQPKKSETHRVRVTVGADRLEYDGNCSTYCAGLVLVKTHLNSTISTQNTRHATLDIVYYYYGTPMTLEEYEYVRMSLDIIPE